MDLSGLGRIPMVWRTALVWGALCLAELFFTFMLGWNEEQYAVLWLLSRGVLTIVILYLASSLRLLQKEGQAIADGQTDYKGKPIPAGCLHLKSTKRICKASSPASRRPSMSRRGPSA